MPDLSSTTDSTGKVSPSSAVSIHPDSFTDEQLDLSILSLEQVVARFKDTEKRRSAKSEPENEAELLWPVRYAPVELMSSLKVVASHLAVSRRTLTKCMSRQLADWYTNSLGLDGLRSEYENIYAKIKLSGYSTLRIQAENPAKFSFACPLERVGTSIATIRWVMAKLMDAKEVVGVNGIDLLLVGMAWSLTTLENQDWDRRNIERYYVPETGNLNVLIGDRLADVRALCAKYNRREEIGYNELIYREKV